MIIALKHYYEVKYQQKLHLFFLGINASSLYCSKNSIWCYL